MSRSEHNEELAALYALGLLGDAEQADFESALLQDGELQTLADQLFETTAVLACAAPGATPPAGLKDSILRAATNDSGTAQVPPPVASSRWRDWAPWAMAAGFALAAVWFGAHSYALEAENDSLRTQRELAEISFRFARAQLGERTLLAEKMIADLGNKLRHSEDLSRLKITALASLLGNSAEAKAIAVWDPEQQAGLLTVEKLPAVAAEQDYQIWVIDPQYPIPVDGGVFKPDSTGKATLTFKGDKPISNVAAFAISLEKAGGVPKAEGPLVLLGKR